MADPFSERQPPPADTNRPPTVELYGQSPADDARQPPSGAEIYKSLERSDYEPTWVEVAAPRARNRIWLHTLLFALTVLTTTYIGMFHWAAFASMFGARRVGFVPLVRGFWYSGTILLILGAHELGHYFACRYYRIDASLPYFIPAPPPFITGTLGALIRIRQQFPNKRALFDVGIAGPIAGFIFAVPALFIGVALSNVAWVPPHMVGEELGEPLLFKMASWLIWGHIPDGASVNLHPMAFAAWFGVLATMLNLIPACQLDGGHITYAALGRRATIVTRITMVLVVGLGVVFASANWLFWALLLAVMIWAFGLRHPPTLDDRVPLGTGRKIMAAVAIVIFILCFMPAPIQLLQR